MLTVVANDIPFIGLIIACILVLLVTAYKVFVLHFKCFYEYLGFAAVCILYTVLKSFMPNAVLAWDIIFFVGSTALFGYSIYDLIIKSKMQYLFSHSSKTLLKNAPFDYYLQADKNDIITDFSESFETLTELEKHELYDTLAFQTIMSRLYITHINREEVSDTSAPRLYNDYIDTSKTNNVVNFELTIIEGKEIVDLLVIVQPLFLNKRFIGRNIYFKRNNKSSLSNMEKGLNNALNAIKDDRAQLYIMMSMIEDVVMYYDFNTSTYVTTEVMAKYLGLTNRELSIGQFVEMIHPDDLSYYQDQSAVISSSEVTRLKYRLKLGQIFYEVFEDVCYLNKDGKLISIIHLANYEEEIKEEVEEEIKESVTTTDYKTKLEDTMKVLVKLLGEDNE